MDSQVLTKAVEVGGRLRVRSALNPILWLCGLTTTPVLIAGILRPESLPIWIYVIGCAPLAVALFGFVFLLFIDRDKLQSEEYQLQKRALELSQQKGDPHPIDVNPKTVIEDPNARESGERM